MSKDISLRDQLKLIDLSDSLFKHQIENGISSYNDILVERYSLLLYCHPTDILMESFEDSYNPYEQILW
jgi:hypothetical protein